MGTPVHMKFSFRGVFVDTPEEWSFGCNFSRNNGTNADATVDDIDAGAVTSALAAFIGHGGSSSFHTDCKATEWRAYTIGPEGTMEGNPLQVDVSGDAINGIASLRYPPQVSLVATLVAEDRGPGRFGRMFLPGVASPLGEDYRISIGDATGWANQVGDFLKAVSDSIDLVLTDSSEGLNISRNPAPDGSRQTIHHVEVGRVYDTLRSRRHAMIEERVVAGPLDW